MPVSKMTIESSGNINQEDNTFKNLPKINNNNSLNMYDYLIKAIIIVLLLFALYHGVIVYK